MITAKRIRVGTRGSRLALTQTDTVVQALRAAAPRAEIVTETIVSTGDSNADAPLQTLGIGVFTKTLEDALLEGRIDLAVHSLKDMPTETTAGLMILPVLAREDARDVLVNRWSQSLADLPEGARIGTSSPRRAAQLRHGRKDLEFLPIRGNVETRIAKATGPDFDGAILAAAGIKRLGLTEHVAEYLSPHISTPAPGQAALAVELRSSDADLLALVRTLTHRPTAAAVTAERELLRAAGGGCQLPVGAFAEVDGTSIRMFATVTPPDGSTSYRVEVTGDTADPEVVGRAAYQALVEQGAGTLLHGGAS